MRGKQPPLAECVPKFRRLTKGDWAELTKGMEAAGSDGMEDVRYLQDSAHEACAAAVRSRWVRKHVWDGWTNPFNSSETTQEMEQQLRSMMDSGSGSAAVSPGPGKGKGQGKAKRKSLTELAKLALVTLQEAEKLHRKKVERMQGSHGNVACPACGELGKGEEQLLCLACGHPLYCSCLLSVPCPACVASASSRKTDPPTAATSDALRVEVKRQPPGCSLGLTFKGLFLTKALDPNVSRFVGHRIASVQDYSVNTPFDLAHAAAALKTHRSLVLRFLPLYLPHSSVRLLGRSPRAREHDLVHLGPKARVDRLLLRFTMPPAAPSIFGADLLLENIAEAGKAAVFRCVTRSFYQEVVKAGASPAPTKKRKLQQARQGGFVRAALKRIYPTPFSPNVCYFASHAPRLPKSCFTPCTRALKKLFELKQSEEPFQLFLRPVSTELDQAPGYLDIIKTPMDLGTVQTLLDNNLYSTPEEAVQDIRTVWSNCRTYNPETHYLHSYASSLEALFNKLHSAEIQKASESGVASVLHTAQDLLKQKDEVSRNTLAAELVSRLSQMPRFSEALNTIFTKLTSVNGTCRWTIAPLPPDSDHLDLQLRIIPSQLPNDLVHSIFTSIQCYQKSGVV